MSNLYELLKNTVDCIDNDAEFMETEYNTIHEYCRKHKYQLDKIDMETIIQRGLEYNYTTWKQAFIEEMWSKFSDVPMNPETECIESEWNGFPAGIHREKIWYWFEETFNVSIAEDLMRL